MFWTAFVWGIGVTAGGSIGLMVFVVLFAAWSMLVKTPTMRRAEELSELAYTAMLHTNELSEQQLTQITAIAASADIMAGFVTNLEKVEFDLEEKEDDDGSTDTGTDTADLCDHPHYSGLAGLGGFEG